MSTFVKGEKIKYPVINLEDWEEVEDDSEYLFRISKSKFDISKYGNTNIVRYGDLFLNVLTYDGEELTLIINYIMPAGFIIGIAANMFVISSIDESYYGAQLIQCVASVPFADYEESSLEDRVGLVMAVEEDGFGTEISKKGKSNFKKNMGSFANWNAQEGEAGYIENRTHYFNEQAFVKFSTLLYNNDTVNQILEIDTNTDPNVVYINNNGTYLRFSYTESTDINELGLDIYLKDNGTTTSIYIDYSNCADPFDYIIAILNTTSFAFSSDENDIVFKLNENFIPNTILKTTPQTLSDTDKNQALSNLGIDPIVWKYLCGPIDLNPFLRGEDTFAPEDILGEKYTPKYEDETDYEYEVYKFKPNVCAGMFRPIYHPDKTDGELWNVIYFDHDEGIVTFGNVTGAESNFVVIDDGGNPAWRELDW